MAAIGGTQITCRFATTAVSAKIKRTSKVEKKANSDSSDNVAVQQQTGVRTRTLIYGTPIMMSESRNVLAQFPKPLNKRNIAKISVLNPRQLVLSPDDDLGSVPGVKLPSVSAILGCTRSSDTAERLYKWQQRIVRQKGLDGFKQYMKERVVIGSQLHATVAKYITKQERTDTAEVAEKLPENIRGYWQSIAPILKEIGECKHTEKALVHQRLYYQGIFDAVAMHKDQLVLLDWKTVSTGSAKQRSSTLKELYDDPVQLAAYVGAFNADRTFSNKVQRAAIVMANEDGSPGVWVDMDGNQLQQYWTLWLQRLTTFWTVMSNLPDNATADFVHKSTRG